MGFIVASTFGHQFRIFIFIFNINSLWPVPYPLLLHYYLHRILFQLRGLVFLSNGHCLLLFILKMRARLIYVVSRSPTHATPNLIIQVWLTLSKDRLIRSKYGMLYDNPKVRLPRDDDCSLKLGYDCAVWFISQGVVEEVKKRGEKTKLAKTLTTKTWYIWNVYRMHCKSGYRWIEYWQPIDLSHIFQIIFLAIDLYIYHIYGGGGNLVYQGY